MRLAARIDANQPEFTKALRALGYSVEPTHTLGRGRPDLIVGAGGRNWWFELKDPAQPPSARVLTPDEHEFHQTWRGHAAVIESVEQAIAMMRAS